MTEKEFKKYEGKTTFGFVRGVNVDGCIVIGYDSIRNESLIVGRYDSRGWIRLLPTDVVDENLKRQFESFLYVNVKNVKMEKELDLTSILKGCEGVELWSNVFGLCKLERIIETVIHPIVLSITNNVGVNISECISKDGLYNNAYNGECILWPSETNRDWSTFKKPIKVNDDDWVVACDGEGCGHINKYCNINRTWKYVIPFEKYNPTLTDEELNKLSIV